MTADSVAERLARFQKRVAEMTDEERARNIEIRRGMLDNILWPYLIRTHGEDGAKIEVQKVRDQLAQLEAYERAIREKASQSS